MSEPRGPLVVDAAASGGCVQGICRDDTVIVADCKSGDIFQVTNDPVGTNAALDHDADTGESPQNGTDSLSSVYDEAASVYVVRTVKYRVALSSGEPNLSRDKVDGAGYQPIAEGVADMQIEYGVDTDDNNTANRYVPASGVVSVGDGTDWDDVVSVRVSLLLQSTEQGLTDSTQRISYNGGTVDCPDRRICQVMTATFTIRNRVQ
jgi:type IV pilus assembly protein PilW